VVRRARMNGRRWALAGGVGRAGPHRRDARCAFSSRDLSRSAARARASSSSRERVIVTPCPEGRTHPSRLACRRLRGCPDGDAVYRSVCILRAMTDRPNAHDALLGATSELTYEYGITGTGVDAIAARAEVTNRTLYEHFGTKDRVVAEALNDRNRRALLALETNARRRSEETGELVILALFDVIENALRTKTKAGCAFINASLEINRPGHPVREAALAHR